MSDDMLDRSADQFRLLTDKAVFLSLLAIIAFLWLFHPWLWPYAQ